ncbi:Hypothetical_protein [Hexamita inflata]|uniref:Hypothetical_protein n=1 Tax=Hexamita inflata TaxID=28002 RepID=A0ABP1HK46_9EUKA
MDCQKFQSQVVMNIYQIRVLQNPSPTIFLHFQTRKQQQITSDVDSIQVRLFEKAIEQSIAISLWQCLTTYCFCATKIQFVAVMIHENEDGMSTLSHIIGYKVRVKQVIKYCYIHIKTLV